MSEPEPLDPAKIIRQHYKHKGWCIGCLRDHGDSAARWPCETYQLAKLAQEQAVRLEALEGRSIQPLDPDDIPECSCAMSEVTMVHCDVHGYDSTVEIFEAWTRAQEAKKADRK
jgi:hypothetical protein